MGCKKSLYKLGLGMLSTALNKYNPFFYLEQIASVMMCSRRREIWKYLDTNISSGRNLKHVHCTVEYKIQFSKGKNINKEILCFVSISYLSVSINEEEKKTKSHGSHHTKSRVSVPPSSSQKISETVFPT